MAPRPTAADVPVTLDAIVIDDERGRRRVSLTDFLRLPLAERIRLILGQKLTFFGGDREIDRETALKSLMESMSKFSGASR